MLVYSVRAAVTLIYFHADGQDGRVVLEWETATELDNAGFFINRSLQEQSGFTRISSFIPAQGDGLTGARYVYTDTNVTNGTTYWYLLESIDFGQNSQFYQPPTSAIPGDETSPTSTATATATGTLVDQTVEATSTATSTATRTATQPPTATNRPTNTPVGGYPGPATSTTRPQSATQTPLGALTPTPNVVSSPTAVSIQPTTTITPTITATFMPLPEIVMQFPQAPSSSEFQAAPASQSDSQIDAESQDAWRSSGRYLFMGFIVMIWLLLGGWFFFSIRKLE